VSNIHDQAMHYIHQQVLERLLNHMSQAQRASLQLLIQRLLVAAGGPEYIGTFRLLVLQGSDRRSAHLLAILRAAQLSIALRAPVTFQLRVVVVCLPAASGALLEHHERSFNALFMHDDPRVQLQMVDAGEVVAFSRRPSAVARPWMLARDALLLFGHLVDGRPEALLGSRMHLELAATLRQVLEGEPIVDAWVTPIPLSQRRRYLAWARRALRLAGGGGAASLHLCMATLAAHMSQLHDAAGMPLVEPGTLGCDQVPALPTRLIAIDDLLPQLLGEGELDAMMQCRFEPAEGATPLAAFLDPLALAQLHDLRSRCRVPASGRQALQLVGPQPMLQASLSKGYGVEQTQLLCMLYSPIADHGRGLEHFLQSRHADMLVALPYLHRALQGRPCPDAVKDWLVNTSGLSLAQLRAVYDGRLHRSARRLLASLARRDVHLALLGRPPGAARPAAGRDSDEA